MEISVLRSGKRLLLHQRQILLTGNQQYISVSNPEAALANAATLYGLNPYILCLTNPVNMVYNGYTIETNAVLSYDPPTLSKWDLFWKGWNQFWQSDTGQIVSIGIFVAATLLAIVCPAFQPFYIGAIYGMTFSLIGGGIIAGFSRQQNGKSFAEKIQSVYQ